MAYNFELKTKRHEHIRPLQTSKSKSRSGDCPNKAGGFFG